MSWVPFEPIFEAVASRIRAVWEGGRTTLADLDVPMATWIGRLGLPLEGTASLVDAIAKDVGGEFRLGAVVTRIERDDTGVTVALLNGGGSAPVGAC
jgi:flavin-dependent amine oxidoreductase